MDSHYNDDSLILIYWVTDIDDLLCNCYFILCRKAHIAQCIQILTSMDCLVRAVLHITITAMLMG